MHDFERALMRPKDFFKLSAETRWAIDKALGILDWDGDCPHQKDKPCPPCMDKLNKHFGIKKGGRV